MEFATHADPLHETPGGGVVEEAGRGDPAHAGVAHVVMHFTPPFLHHYTVLVTIRDNVGIAIRKPDYSPTSVFWYTADGHFVRKYADWQALRYDNCLAKHKHNCR